MDDGVASFRNEPEAIRIMTQVKKIHAAAGFELRGFVSISAHVEQVLRSDGAETPSALSDAAGLMNPEKVLGMRWLPDLDQFTFSIVLHRVPTEVFNGECIPTNRDCTGGYPPARNSGIWGKIPDPKYRVFLSGTRSLSYCLIVVEINKIQ